MNPLYEISDIVALKKNKGEKTFESDRTNHLVSERTAREVVTKVQQIKELETAVDALILITGLAQNGGANSSAIGRARFTFDGKELASMELESILKEINPKATVRQLCRTLATDIGNTANIFGIPGDLSKIYETTNPYATVEELAWASHFQKENPSCPERVRVWIQEHFKK